MASTMSIDRPAAVILPEDELDEQLRKNGEPYESRRKNRDEARAEGRKVVSEEEYRQDLWLALRESRAEKARERVGGLRDAGKKEEISENDLKLIADSDRRRAAALALSSAFLNPNPPATNTATATVTTFRNPFASSNQKPASTSATTSSSPNTSRNATAKTNVSTPGNGLSLKQMASKAKDAKRRMVQWKKFGMEENVSADDSRIVKEYEQMKNAAEIMSASTAPTVSSISEPALSGHKSIESETMGIDSSNKAGAAPKNTTASPKTNQGATQTFQPQTSISTPDTVIQSPRKVFDFTYDPLQTTPAPQPARNAAVSFNVPNVNASSTAIFNVDEKTELERSRQGAFLQQVAQENAASGIAGPFGTKQAVTNPVAPLKPGIYGYKPGKLVIQQFGPNANPFGKKVPGPPVGALNASTSAVQGSTTTAQQSKLFAAPGVLFSQGNNEFSFAPLAPAQPTGSSTATSATASQGNNPLSFAPVAQVQAFGPSSAAPVTTLQGNNPFSFTPIFSSQATGTATIAPVPSSQGVNLFSIPPSGQAVGSTTGFTSFVAAAPALSIAPTGFTSFPRPASPGKKNRSSRFGSNGLQASATNTSSFVAPPIKNPASQVPQPTPFFGNAIGSNPATMTGALPNFFQSSVSTTFGQNTNAFTPSSAAGSLQASLTFGPLPLAPPPALFSAQPSSLNNVATVTAPAVDTTMGDAPELVPAVGPSVTSMEGVEEIPSAVPETASTEHTTESRTDSEMMDAPTLLVQPSAQIEQSSVTATDAVMDEAPVPAALPLPVSTPQPMQISTSVDPATVVPDGKVASDQDKPEQVEPETGEIEQDGAQSEEDDTVSAPEPAADTSSIEDGGHLGQSEVAADDGVLEDLKSPPASSEEPSGTDSQSIVEPPSPDVDQTEEDVSNDSSKGEEVWPVRLPEPVELSKVVEELTLPVVAPPAKPTEHLVALETDSTMLLSEAEWRHSSPLLLGRINVLRASEEALEGKVESLKLRSEDQKAEIKTLKTNRKADRKELEEAYREAGKLRAELVALNEIRDIWYNKYQSTSEELKAERNTRASMVTTAKKAYAKSKETSEQALMNENEDLKERIRELQIENSKMRSGQGQEQQTADEQRRRLRYLGEYQYQSRTMKKSLSALRGFTRADHMFAMEENNVGAAAIALGQLQMVDALAAEFNQARRYEEVGDRFVRIPEAVFTSSPTNAEALEESDEKMMDGRDDSATWAHLDSKTVLYTRKNRSIAKFLAFDSPCKTRPCRDPACNHGAPPTLKSALAQKSTLPTQVPSNSVIAVIPSTNLAPTVTPNPPATLPPAPVTTAAVAPAPLVPAAPSTILPPMVIPNPPATLAIAPAILNSPPVVPQATTGGANSSTTAALPAIVQAKPKAWYKRSPPRWVFSCLALLGGLFIVARVMMALLSFNTNSITPHTAQNSLISLNNTCAFVTPTITAVSCGTESLTAIITTQTLIETGFLTSTDSAIFSEASGGDHAPFVGDDVWEDGPAQLDRFSYEVPADIIVFVTVVVLPVTIMAWACGGW